MTLQANTHNIEALLCETRPIQAAARWIFREGLLPQFLFAKKLLDRQDSPADWTPMEDIPLDFFELETPSLSPYFLRTPIVCLLDCLLA